MSRGVRTERPRQVHECGGVIDAHPNKDASVCRKCGTELHGRAAFDYPEPRIARGDS